jgi:Holliday junction DNA helicase RuvA
MLAYIQGVVIYADTQSVIVRAGDLGYRVHITDRARAAISCGDEVSFFLHQHIREHAEELYGFAVQEEYILFQRLISVSGVGPKSALSVLAIAPTADIISAIVSGDAALLKKVSGIGSKTAERIVLELKNGFAGVAHPSSLEGGDVGTQYDDLANVLIHMGYSRTQAHRAVREVPSTIESLEDKIKYALRALL